MDAASSLYERARDALSRHAADQLAELERAWSKTPWSIGITAVDAAARDALLAALCVGSLPLGTTPLRVRRGTQLRCTARRSDGSSESCALGDSDDDRQTLEERAAAARDALAQQVTALARLDHDVPLLARRRPKWWQLWLWPIYFVLAWRSRARLAELRATEQVVADHGRAVVAAEDALRDAGTRERQARARFEVALRTLLDGRDVRGVELEVTDGPLPDGVELVEIADAARKTPADVDALLVVEQGALCARDPAGARVPLGAHADVIAALPQIAADARGLRLAKRAADALAAFVASIDSAVARAEDDFRARLSRLEAMRIVDAPGFAQVHLARLQPQSVSSVHAVMEHAGVHLGGELAQLASQWIGSLAGAEDGDQLAAAIERIEDSAPTETQRIADEVKLLVGNGIAGVAHDLLPELAAALKPHGGAPLSPKTKVELPAVEVLPSLGGASAKLGRVVDKLAGLFKGFDAKRGAAREKAHARLEHLKEVANAELLDVEPKLHAAIAEGLGKLLAEQIAQQAQWLDAELVAEHAKIQRDREAFVEKAAARDAARVDHDALAADISRLELELPVAAAAASSAA